MHSYFTIWSEKREGASLLEQALGKARWRGPRETGAQRTAAAIAFSRAAAREENGTGAG